MAQRGYAGFCYSRLSVKSRNRRVRYMQAGPAVDGTAVTTAWLVDAETLCSTARETALGALRRLLESDRPTKLGFGIQVSSRSSHDLVFCAHRRAL